MQPFAHQVIMSFLNIRIKSILVFLKKNFSIKNILKSYFQKPSAL